MNESDRIRLACPHCDKRLSVAASAAGKRVRCPTCTKIVAVPLQADVEEEPTESTPRRLWPWFAGGGGVLVLVVGMGIWFLAGSKKPLEPAGSPEVAVVPTNPSDPAGVKPSEAPPAPLGKREWQVAIQHAKLQGEYQEPGGSGTAVRPEGSGRLLAIVGIEFEAVVPTPGSLQDRLAPGRDDLSTEEMEYMADAKVPPLVKSIGKETASEVLVKPARLFLSTRAELVPPNGTGLRPTWTSAPPGLLTFTPRGIKGSFGFASKSAVGKDDPATLRYVRRPELTAALVQPGRKIALELVYTVPAKTEKARLRFYDCPPLDVSFLK